MSFMENLKEAIGMMMHPGQGTKRQMGIGDALKFYFSIMVIPLILGIVLSVALGAVAAGFTIIAIGTVVLYYIIALPLGILIDAGIYHLIIGKLFKLYKGDYARAVNAFMYGVIPATLILWIAFPLTSMGTVSTGASIVASALEIIFGIWGFVVMLFALSAQLNMGKLKAFGTLVLEGVIIGIIYLVIAAAVGVSLAAIGL